MVDGETFAGWDAVARSLHGRTGVMFGPVITTEAHLAFAGARVRSNNTAEMSASVEALSFLGLVAQLPVMRTLVFSLIPSMLLVFAWAQFMLARTYSLDSLANCYC